MIPTILTLIKVGVATFGAALLAAWAGYGLRADDARRRIARYLEACLLLLLALIVLTRGAPHNNPAIYWVFEKFGALGLIGVVVTLLGGGVIVGLLLSRSTVASSLIDSMDSESGLRRGIAAVATLAMLAAAEPVIRFWNVPGWGDAMFWDRIAHLIARGEMPLGHSYYMPVYQYATAALYWAFGHHFAVQQVANVMWAPVTVVFLCLAARDLGCGNRAVLLVGLLAGTHDYLRYTPHLMQIENWYIPVLSIALWAATRCALRPNFRSAALAGLMIGLVLSIRAQGAFMCAFLCTAPLWLSRDPWPLRLKQFIVVGLVFAAVLVPWTIRNWVVEGRLTPTSSQGPAHMVLALEPTAFFGIRRDLVGPELWESWVRRYPDLAERERAMGRYIVEANLSDPLRFFEGAAWRSLAFYGLLPEGVFAKGGPQATDWGATGKTWLLRNLATLSLLAAAILSFAWSRDRRSVFVGFAIAGSMALVFFVGFTEARVHYPTLPLLFLLSAFAISGGVSVSRVSIAGSVIPSRRAALVLAIAFAIVVVSVWSDRAMFQPIREPALRISESVDLDRSVPDMTGAFIANKLRTGSHAPPGLQDDVQLRLRVALTNHHLPVKWYADEIKGFPAFSLEPNAPAFFRAVVVNPDMTYDWGTSPVVAVRLGDARFDHAPVEDDVVEIQGRLIVRWESGMAFVEVKAARVIGRSKPAAEPLMAGGNEEDQ